MADKNNPFDFLNDLVRKIGDLASKGDDLARGNVDKVVKGVYGFRVKFGLGEEEFTFEPFGNVRRDSAGRTVVQEVREPVVDVFDEKDHILVVAEMPGIAASDVQIDVKDDVLTLSAQRGDKKYRTEVVLPRVVSREAMKVTCNNGVVEIRCKA